MQYKWRPNQTSANADSVSHGYLYYNRQYNWIKGEAL